MRDRDPPFILRLHVNFRLSKPPVTGGSQCLRHSQRKTSGFSMNVETAGGFITFFCRLIQLPTHRHLLHQRPHQHPHQHHRLSFVVAIVAVVVILIETSHPHNTPITVVNKTSRQTTSVEHDRRHTVRLVDTVVTSTKVDRDEARTRTNLLPLFHHNPFGSV